MVSGKESKMKTLERYIKAECANAELGGCLGATILNEGIFNDTGKCLVLEGCRCQYFEKYLLPMTSSTPHGEAAESEYRLKFKL